MIDRYSRSEMRAIWTEENKFQTWLEVEILACEAWARLGHIPQDAAVAIRKNARVQVEKIKELEEETKHDVVAFTRTIATTLGSESKWFHYGLTSTDVVDTALGALMKQANQILIQDMEILLGVIARRAKEHKYTLMMGRTHGVHAEPTTFGLKLALWYTEMQRNLLRLKRSADNVAFGKMSGAVGTFANIDPFIEEYVCEHMGLTKAPISTQTLQRDRHAEYMATLALIGTSLEKFATEIRALQKTEFREVEESFSKGQKGSSAMPHKRNPVGCENISGLARVLRGHMLAAYESVPLWHERDISHSSVERIILPDATMLLDYMLSRFTQILDTLSIFPENMRRNMDRSLGLIYSQRVLLTLIGKGLSRERAYDVVQSKAMQTWDEQVPFLECLKAEEVVKEHLTPCELTECFDPSYHLQGVDSIFERVGLS